MRRQASVSGHRLALPTTSGQGRPASAGGDLCLARLGLLRPAAVADRVLRPNLTGTVQQHLEAATTGGDLCLARRGLLRPAAVADRVLRPDPTVAVEDHLEAVVTRRDGFVTGRGF